jgi:uncharacterized membrane protein YbhN (UPF0104 family)
MLRAGFILAVLIVVFGFILPRYIDYSEVFDAFRALTLPQVVLMTILGAIAWFVSGLLFCALVAGLSPIRGMASYLILSGIGSSVPFGPWNMGVVWVVVRGWGIANQPATSGIALYGIINVLGRLALPLLAAIALILTAQLGGGEAGRAAVIGVICTIVFVVVTGLMMSIVRSDRVADWLGNTGQRIVSSLFRRLGRKGEPNVAASIHHFRDQVGEVVRARGLVALFVSILAQVVWAMVLVVALAIVGVPSSALSPAEIFGVYALVSVITLIPISPGGAGVPEILFIAGLSTIAGQQYESTITAGVFLYRLYNWFVPIPLAWILLKLSRRGRPTLPSTTELKSYARGDAA